MALIHINRPKGVEVVHSESLSERWCFICRKRRPFTYFVKRETGDTWYGPWREVRCDVCNKIDADCFPGWSREWKD